MATEPTAKQDSISKRENDLAELEKMKEGNVEDKEDNMREKINEYFVKNTGLLSDFNLKNLLKLIPLEYESIRADTFTKILDKKDKRTNLKKSQLEKLYNKIQNNNVKKKSRDYLLESELPAFLYRSYLNKTRWVCWEEKGVTMYKKETFKNPDGSLRTEIYPHFLYKWNEFEIVSKFIYNNGLGNKSLYNYRLNGDLQWDALFSEIKKTLQTNCFQYDSGKENITNILQQKCDKEGIDISDKITTVLGFTPAGWRLPLDYHYVLSNTGAIGKTVYKNILKVMEREYLYGLKREFLITKNGDIEKKVETTKNPDKIVELKWNEQGTQVKSESFELKKDETFAENEKRFILREYDNIESKKLPREKDVKNYMKNLYNVTGIQYKDIIFAYNLSAPFFYALRDKTNLMPHLALMGKKFSGKSSSTKIGTAKFYGNYVDVLGIGEIDSKARADQYFSSSTFPTAIDDCQNLTNDAIKDIKSYSTNKTFYTRLDKNLDYKAHIPYCSPNNFNFNKDPDIILEDSAFRDRLIRLYIETIEIKPNWQKIYHSAPDGYIGRHIIEKTKDWTLKDVYQIYENASDLGFKGDAREKTIIKMLGVGVWIMKNIFDIDLDISKLPKAISDTKDLMGDTARQFVLHFIEYGSPEFSRIDQTVGVNKAEDDSIKNWVPSHGVWNQIYECKFKEKDGYALDVVNLADLNKLFNTNYSLPTLAHELQEEWKDVNYGTHYNHFQWRFVTNPAGKNSYDRVNKKRFKSIFVPLKKVLPFLNNVKAELENINYLDDEELANLQEEAENMVEKSIDEQENQDLKNDFLLDQI